MFGRIGLGLLHRLTQVEGRASLSTGMPLREDFEAILRLLPLLCPVIFPLVPRQDVPVVLLTDASERRGQPGELGVFLDCPVHGEFYAGAVMPTRLLEWLRVAFG